MLSGLSSTTLEVVDASLSIKQTLSKSVSLRPRGGNEVAGQGLGRSHTPTLRSRSDVPTPAARLAHELADGFCDRLLRPGLEHRHRRADGLPRLSR